MGMSFHCYVSLPGGNLRETYDLSIPPLESNNAGWKTICDPCPVCWTWHFQFVMLDYWKVLHVYHHLTSTHIHPPNPSLDLPISTTSTEWVLGTLPPQLQSLSPCTTACDDSADYGSRKKTWRCWVWNPQSDSMWWWYYAVPCGSLQMTSAKTGVRRITGLCSNPTLLLICSSLRTAQITTVEWGTVIDARGCYGLTKH